MIRPAISFTIAGDKELQARLKEFGRDGTTAAMRGVRVTALEILNNAKERLVQNGSRVTSKLFNSGKVVADDENANFVDVIFSGGGDGYSDYAEFVEFGRRAGRMPPVEAITEWVRKKGIADTYSIKTQRQSKRDASFDNRAQNIAFAIARKIARQGTPAKPFLFPAFEAKKGNIITNIEKELDKLINKMSK